jgi:hypothetical protein
MTLKDKILHLMAETLIVKEKVSDEVANERMSVCIACEYRDKEENKCKKCGCFLDLKTACLTNWNPKKNRNEVTHCPIGKWNDLETTNQYRLIDGLEPLTEHKK